MNLRSQSTRVITSDRGSSRHTIFTIDTSRGLGLHLDIQQSTQSKGNDHLESSEEQRRTVWQQSTESCGMNGKQKTEGIDTQHTLGKAQIMSLPEMYTKHSQSVAGFREQ